MTDRQATGSAANPPKHEQLISAQIIAQIYPAAVNTLLQPGRFKWFVTGGRGLGKSKLLEHLAFTLGAAQERCQVVKLTGSEWEACRTEIQRTDEAVRDGGQHPHILLDDVDQLVYRSVYFNDPQIARTIKSLLYLVSRSSSERRVFITTSDRSQEEVFDLLMTQSGGDENQMRLSDAFSSFLASCDPFQLNPWMFGWDSRLDDAIGALALPIKGQARQLCQEILRQLTGGHPSLVTPALTELHRLITNKQPAAEEQRIRVVLGVENGAAVEEGKTLLRAYLESHLERTGLPPLRQNLNGLRRSEREEENEAFRVLIAIATGRTDSAPPHFRIILERAGLVYRDVGTGGHVIPGELLRQEIQRHAERIKEELQLLADPDPKSPTTHGTVILRHGERSREVMLQGNQWAILRLLADNRPRILSLKELEEGSGLTSETAVRSTIQRLYGKLDEAGMQGIIDNHHGRGYSLGTNPGFKHLAGD